MITPLPCPPPTRRPTTEGATRVTTASTCVCNARKSANVSGAALISAPEGRGGSARVVATGLVAAGLVVGAVAATSAAHDKGDTTPNSRNMLKTTRRRQI